MHKVTLSAETGAEIDKDIYSAANAKEAATLAYSTEVSRHISANNVIPVPCTTDRFLILGEYMASATVREVNA